eukprot:2560107-Alexandrium_andersonii.AAC.1
MLLAPRRAPPAVLRRPAPLEPWTAALPSAAAASPPSSPAWSARAGPGGQEGADEGLRAEAVGGCVA